MRFRLSAFLLSTVAVAQLPPPPVNPVTSPSTTIVGTANQTQVGGTGAGNQHLHAYCDSSFARSSSVGSFGVVLGGSIFWISICNDPSGGGLGGGYPSGTPGAIALFMLSAFTSFTATVAGAATNFDQLFVDPATAVLLAPAYQFTLGSPAPDLWFIELPIPNNTALIGSIWQAQAARVDPTNGLIYLSDDSIVEVRQ